MVFASSFTKTAREKAAGRVTMSLYSLSRTLLIGLLPALYTLPLASRGQHFQGSVIHVVSGAGKRNHCAASKPALGAPASRDTFMCPLGQTPQVLRDFLLQLCRNTEKVGSTIPGKDFRVFQAALVIYLWRSRHTDLDGSVTAY